MRIAIHPDNYGPGDASSPRWTELLAARGHETKSVNVRAADILDQVRGCHGFMWRWAHFNGMFRIARRLLPVLEHALRIPVYPSQATCWHYDDKIAQGYLLEACGIPAPRTYTFFHPKEAERFIAQARFPLVLKLAAGAGSSNVRLLETSAEALAYVPRMFSTGCFALTDFDQPELPPQRSVHELQIGYLLLQEFLPDNPLDTRVTVIGRRAFGFRRLNRPGDFRASGSGRIDHDIRRLDERFVRLAFLTAERLGTQSCAIDGLYRGDEPVVGELSYTYVSQAVRDCPGHWQLDGTAADGTLRWVEQPMWPEEAQIEDFLTLLEARP
jgi:glutathione synthase/RimK-type ligase-like ATP-grasp enzyme